MSTSIQLTATSGAVKGTSWPINEGELLIGRASTCDVIVSDPSVSRLHCKIVRENGKVRLVDFAQKNSTLLNGQPITETPLYMSDEIAVGTELFLITGTPPVRRLTRRFRPENTTKKLSVRQAIYLNARPEDLVAQGRPFTIEDLFALYACGRTFSRAASVRELVDSIYLHLRQRFTGPLWIARYRGEDADLHVFRQTRVEGEPEVAPPVAKLWQAIHDQQALMDIAPLTENGSAWKGRTFAAPITANRAQIGALAVGIDRPRGIEDERDLQFLLALAHEVAPFFVNVERAERMRTDLERLRDRAGESGRLIGKSKCIRRVRALLTEVGPTNLNVLILGATGAGKELAARMLHDRSHRATCPFVAVNCAAVPAPLFESEMFGVEKGAFTGATRSRRGRFEQANGGTLFLDEVAEMSLENQARMLRAVEQRAFTRVGGETEVQVDVRIVAATNSDLRELVRSGRFRDDLFHRLNGLEVRMPSLKERPSDIPILIEHFMRANAHLAKRPITGIDEDALELLCQRHWAGNVRELQSVVAKAVMLAEEERIGITDLRFAAFADSPASLRSESLAEIEKRHIAIVIEECGANMSEAARILGISRSTLYSKLRTYELKPSE